MNGFSPRRIVATDYGDESVLAFVETVTPRPGPAEVTVEVSTIGVNPVDRKRYGNQKYSQMGGETKDHFPLRLGVEAAGTVTAIGPRAVGPAGPVEVGDEVIAYRIAGAYAEEVTVDASAIIPKPVELSWEQAACVMLAGTTAAHTLAAVAARPGQTVLVHGISGSVGRALAQLARLDHVRVVGTTSGRNNDRLRRYDVEPIEYGAGLSGRARRASPSGYDAAIDLVGTDEAVDTSLELVPNRSRIATVVAFDRAGREGFQGLGGSGGQDESGPAIRENTRLRLTAFAQTKRLDVEVARVFDFEDVKYAHEMLATGGLAGHIALRTRALRP